MARKGSQEGGSSTYTPSQAGKSVASGSVASVSPSVEQGGIEMLQDLIQQQQMQKGSPPLPLQERQQQQLQQQQQQYGLGQQYMRRSTDDSMQRIPEDSRSAETKDSSGSANYLSEQSAGQHAGEEASQQAAGEAAGERGSPSEQALDRASDRNYVHTPNDREELHAAGELLNEAVRKLSPEMADAAAEALAAAVVKSSAKERNPLGYLSEMSANDLLVYEGDPMESFMLQSHKSDGIDGDDDEGERVEGIKEGVSQDGSIQIHSESSSSYSTYSSHASISTGGYDNADDDENDVDDMSYEIGMAMGLHSRLSVEQSDISDTASEQESNRSSVNDEELATETTVDSGNDKRNEKDGQYIGHYLNPENEKRMHDNIQSSLSAKRPLDIDATYTINEFTDHDTSHRDTVSTLSAGDRFPLTSQTIAIADNVDTQEASGAISARFGKLLQECRDLTETCGDGSLRDSMTSSYVDESAANSNLRSSSSNFRSSTIGNETNKREQQLSSSQLKTAAAMAAANSSSLQSRQYSNPVTQRHEIDTSDGKHLHISQLTVDPALHSSLISSDYRGSMMSMPGYRELRSSTLAGQLNTAEMKESSKPSEDQSVEEFNEPKQSEEVDDYVETFQVPIDGPLGRRAPRSETPMTKSVKSFVSELSMGVDRMYGDTDEDQTYDKSVNFNEDLTAPFDPSQFLAELDPSSYGFDRKASEFASDISDSNESHEQNKDNVDVVPKIETNEAASAKENTYASPPPASPPHVGADILANKRSKEIASPARPLSPSYKSRASYISSEFSADEGGLLVGFGQRNVKRSITSKSSVSSSTSSGAFSSGSDDSSSDESSSSGSSGSSSSSSSGDDSDSSPGSLDNIARNGLHIQSSRDSVSELSFGGASALMALQANRTLHQTPIRPSLREEEEAEEADKQLSFSTHTPSTPGGSKNSSNESEQQGMNDSSSRTGRRNSVTGEVDQLEKLDEVSESTASDFLDDVSSIGDNNYAVQKFFSSTNERETTSNASALWSSATSTGASALMALQANRTLHQTPIRPSLREEEEAEEADKQLSFSTHTPSTPGGSKNSSNESEQQGMNDSSSRTGRRNSVTGEVDQLEKLDEVSESTASDFLDDVSSIGDNNYAVQKFFSSTNERETTSNASALWSSATSTDYTPPIAQRNLPVARVLHDSLSSSSSPILNLNTEQRLSSSSKSSSFPRRSVSPPKSSRSQGTGVSGNKSETMQDEKSSSTMSSLSQNIPTIQQGLTSEIVEVPTLSNITEAAVDEAAETQICSPSRGSPVIGRKKDSPTSLGSSSSRHNSFTRRKSINSGKSQSSASAASSGSYYKGILARAAAMNQDEDGVAQVQQDEDVMQLRSYSHNLENLLEATPSQDDSSQIEVENASLHRHIQKLTVSAELSEEARGEFNSAELDDISSMSSVVSKARTSSRRASFIGSGKVIEAKQEPKIEAVDRQFDKQSMKSSDSYDGGELYEDFPCEKDNDEVIRRNWSNASQVVPEKEETDARRPWKTATREEAAAIPDESVLSAQTGSQRSSIFSGQNNPEGKEQHGNNSDDDTSDDGSLSELFGSKEALKRMGLYSSVVVDLEQSPRPDEDVHSGASDQDKKVAARDALLSDEASARSTEKSDGDRKVGSLTESIRSSIQSIKEQFFGEKGLDDDGYYQRQTQLSATSIDNSDGSLSLPQSDEVTEIPKSPARMLADAAREMSARLDHSISSRSLAASKTNDETNVEHHDIVRGSSVSSVSEEEKLEEDVFQKAHKDDNSHSSNSRAQDDKSITAENLESIDAIQRLFKKKNKSAVESSSKTGHNVAFDLSGDEDEEIGLPPKSYGEDDTTRKTEAKPKEVKNNQNGAKASWWRGKLTKPQLICGSVTVIVLIILFSIIGATVPNRNRNMTQPPTRQPTEPPSRLNANWVQVGGDLKGESPGDDAGFSVSASENGYTVIVGARRNGDKSNDTENRGAAQVFRFDALTGFYKPIWFYNGEAKGDQCGFSVSMSKDGRRIAIGCPGSDTYGKNSGKVRLFMEEELSKTWVMVSEFYGEGIGDLFGASVSLSPEGTHLAVGAPYYSRNEVKRSGSSYAYREITESVWQSFGSPMRGVVEESLFGWSLSLSQGGMFLAVGAPEMSEISLNGGFVKVFSSEANGFDLQQTISNGVPGDRFGFSVSMAGDETLQRVAIGAPGNSANHLEGSGLASVYEHSGNGWSNAGDDLIGESQGENLGYVVSLTPDAKMLVVGVPKKQIDGEIVGQVQVFNVGSGALTPAGGKYGLSGEKFGVSATISNNGKRFFGGATEANLVRVYEDIPIVDFNN